MIDVGESLASRSQSSSAYDLDQILAPVGLRDFVASYWDKQPLHLESGSGEFSGLADVNTVRDLIKSGSPWKYRRMPEMYLDGGFIPHEDLVRKYVDMDGREAPAPNLPRIHRLLEAGATVNAFGMDAHFPTVMALKLEFARAFTAEVEAAFFYSSKNHLGLSPHYDCVEIFVFQVSGSKRWHVSSQRVNSPLVGYGTATQFDISAPHATFDVVSGDLLYLPRGTFHHAVATSEESLHVTFAVKTPTYMDMLQVLLATSSDVEAIREYLPLGGPVAWDSARAGFLEILVAAVQDSRYSEALRSQLCARAGH
jgi:ribosomal protein L16 Arg81 hydroxylase